jgi:dihydropteroate synthase
MGIVNVTSDSFSGDGLSNHPEAAFAQAVAMIKAGADLVDVGAESTRPGAIPITALCARSEPPGAIRVAEPRPCHSCD